MRIKLSIVSLVGLLLVLSGCSSLVAKANFSNVSFSKDVQPIFNTYCIDCHQTSHLQTEQSVFSLETDLSYKSLVGAPSFESGSQLRVKAGSPDKSYLMSKLLGTQLEVGGRGEQMPSLDDDAPMTAQKPALSQAQISLIQQWISEGAPNN